MPHPNLTSPDPLSEVLRAVQLHGRVFCRSEFSAPWSIAFPTGESFFHLVERGRCWVMAPGAAGPTEVVEGDLVLLPRGDGHRISSRRDLRPVPLEDILTADAPARMLLRWGGGGSEAHLVCGSFRLEDPARRALVPLLPPVMRLAGQGGRAPDSLEASLRALATELRRPGPGTELVVSRLVDLVLVQAVRDWLERQPSAPGWLGALRDPRLGTALGRLQAEPGRPWTLQALARVAGMSPSAFRSRFTALVGEAPLRHLTRWRMQLAASLLREGALRTHEIAARMGYESGAAFSRAFKRHTGESPRAFRRRTAAVAGRAPGAGSPDGR